MKKLLCIPMLSLLFCMVSCNNQPAPGWYLLTDLIEQGKISKTQVSQIAYYSFNGALYDEDGIREHVHLPYLIPLDEETENRIEYEFYWMIKNSPEYDYEEPHSVLLKYYGTYNGYYCVLMDLPSGYPQTADAQYFVIGGYLFLFGGGERFIRCWVPE